jgi:flagellar hook-length control protein FliK
MSSIVAQLLTGTAPGATKAAAGAAGLLASAGDAAAEGGGAFEALLASDTPAAAPRPSGGQVARLPDGATPSGEPQTDATLAAALHAARAQANSSEVEAVAPTAAGEPEKPQLGAAAPAGPEAAADAAPAPVEPAFAAAGASPGATAEATDAAAPTASAFAAEAEQVGPPAAPAAPASPPRPADVEAGEAALAKPGSAKASSSGSAAEPAAQGRPGDSAAQLQAGPEPSRVPADRRGADAAKTETDKTVPVDPRPSAAAMDAMDAAADQAALKRAAGEALVEPALHARRGASDIAAARAPGEQVRAAARAAGSEAGSKLIDRAAPPSGAEPAAAKPSSAPPPALPAPPGFAAASLNAAAMASFNAPLIGDSGLGSAPDGEAELSLEATGSRVDARAEAQRHSLPQVANAHAAARFQPQTVQTLAARIAARAMDGGRVFDIRLDPAELGRVEVRLELGSDNSVRALLSAERADTLAELQRSARDLEKALAEAGLDLAEDGLSFSLSDDGAPAGGEEHDAPRFSTAVWNQSEALGAEPAALNAPVRLYGFELAARRGLDVRT